VTVPLGTKVRYEGRVEGRAEAMSGICGVLFRDMPAPTGPAPLAAALRELTVREGGTGSELRAGSVLLGAQSFPGRLGGTARLHAGGRTLALAFHGTVFNVTELFPPDAGDADRLERLLRLYHDRGPAALGDLRGEFALAIWDEGERELVLATDRFRVHPLFYYRDDAKLVFASRMRSLRAVPAALELSIDPEAVVHVLGSSIIPTPGTIFREVKKLPPGNVLVSRNGDVRIAPYWDIDFRSPSSAPEEDLARTLKARFSDAVSIRLASDGASDRIGTYLSGGVDSSTVTGMLTRLTGGPVRSFSIGFGEERYNEMYYARLSARAFGSPLTEYFVSPAAAYETLPVLIEAFDEPFANASAVPSYLCAKVAREHGVEVLYAGDGGDELFAGNERYAEQRLFEYYRLIPAWARRHLLEPAVSAAAAVAKRGPFVSAKKYISRANIPYEKRMSSYAFYWTMPLAEVLDDGLLQAVGRDFDPYATDSGLFLGAPAEDALERHLYLDLKVTISDNDVIKVTRTSEAAGVTVRYPFLDHRLAEFAATVPSRIRMRGRRLRTFFKRAYSDLLPAETLAKTKHGFGLPVAIWLREYPPFNEMMRDLVLSERSVQRGYFRRDALRTLVDRHRGDPSSFYGTILWNLMVLELWHRRYWC
jgi:asparagine synthase (glutamine-hydrolysing)